MANEILSNYSILLISREKLVKSLFLWIRKKRNVKKDLPLLHQGSYGEPKTVWQSKIVLKHKASCVFTWIGTCPLVRWKSGYNPNCDRNQNVSQKNVHPNINSQWIHEAREKGKYLYVNYYTVGWTKMINYITVHRLRSYKVRWDFFTTYDIGSSLFSRLCSLFS